MNKLLCMVLLSLIVAQINSMPTKSKKVKQVSQSKVILRLMLMYLFLHDI